MPLDICCPIVAWSHVTAPWRDFDAWRDALIARRNSPTLSQIGKLGDDQTVVSAEAIFRAKDAVGWTDRSFVDWGVISAPQFLGRLRMSAAVDRYRTLEIRGASPRIIPTLSQHAVAGSLSVVFQCQGPCFGVGSAQGSLADALVNAASLVASGMSPGFWVTCSHWTPEPLPHVPPEQNEAAECHAIAFAIMPHDSIDGAGAAHELVLRFHPTLTTVDAPFPTIPNLASYLRGESLGDQTSPASNSPASNSQASKGHDRSGHETSWSLALAPGVCAQVRRRTATVPALPADSASQASPGVASAPLIKRA